MSGHFILVNIDTHELNSGKLVGGTWSAKAEHASVGWNQASRAVLTQALNGQPIGNRSGLPPHRYLSFALSSTTPDKVRTYLRGVEWASRLVRPNSTGLGLTALSPKAQTAWATGDRHLALIEQYNHGTVTMEIYYFDSLEMYLP
ncbi:hypothetical protein [Kitasatospora kifunensis]|uniref:Uncharacterized protein n=1 Tax=Kitasatospora kifunensis TaxID=58351 RepID=A0A7W7VZ86_KITKI|nr:hypothetical protein [Kitasatospora kifunensis]MBB4927479.1 hypothetical protein [Kitasatospora kifunensis]